MSLEFVASRTSGEERVCDDARHLLTELSGSFFSNWSWICDMHYRFLWCHPIFLADGATSLQCLHSCVDRTLRPYFASSRFILSHN